MKIEGFVTFNEKKIDVKNYDGKSSLTLRDLGIEKITDVIGLNALKNLQRLVFRSNKIKEIEGLNDNKNLIELDLGINEITKISGLKELKKLEILTFGENRIEKIEGIDMLTNLKTISLRNNRIKNIEGLDSLNKLEIIDLSNNMIENTPENVKALKYLRNFESKPEIILDDNPIFHKLHPDDKIPQKNERREMILFMINNREELSIEFLASRFKVSKMTIHRDLKQLESKHLVKRTHGTVFKIEDVFHNPSFIKFRKLLNISTEIGIERVAKTLGIDENTLIDYLLEWSEYLNFKIKGDLIISDIEKF